MRQNRRQFLQSALAVSATAGLSPGLLACMSPAMRSQVTGRTYDYELNYVPSYGQSLSMGLLGSPAISLTQRFDSLMFAGGVIAQAYSSDLSADYGSLVPLVENSNTNGYNYDLYGQGAPGESPVSGMCEAIKELMESEDSLTPANFPEYRLLGSAPGHSAYDIADLSRGTVPYQRLLYEVSAAKSLAAGMGLTFGVPLITWMQGEADECCLSQSEYAAALTTLFENLNTDVLAITGQSTEILFLTYQTSKVGGFAIACAQLQVAQQMTNVQVATPTYPFPTSASPHLTNEAYKVHGAYFGSAFKRIHINGENWLPLSPRALYATGNQVVISFNVPATPIVSDIANVTSTNPAKPSFGFTLLDASGNILDIDNQVAITGPSEITITAPVAIATGFAVHYGDLINGTGGGNIHDSQGATYVFNGGGLDVAMNNWLTVFSSTVTALSSATTTELSANAPYAVQGEYAYLYARVTSSSGSAVNGTVEFLSGSVVLGTASVTAGSATLKLATSQLIPGQYPLVAHFTGHGSDAPSASAALTGTLRAATATSLSGPSSVTAGATASLKALVTAKNAYAAPTGSVSFYYGSLLLATVELNGGAAVATVTTTGVPAGKYAVTATYAGDGNNGASTSAPLTVTITS